MGIMDIMKGLEGLLCSHCRAKIISTSSNCGNGGQKRRDVEKKMELVFINAILLWQRIVLFIARHCLQTTRRPFLACKRGLSADSSPRNPFMNF